MNIEGSPVVNDVVVLRCYRDDAHLRMLTQQLVRDAGSYARLVERDDHEIWQGALHALGNLRLLGNFPDNFDVGLIRERCKYDFPHEPGTMRHEDPDCFFHCALHTAGVGLPSVGPPTFDKCPFVSWLGEDSKKGY